MGREVARGRSNGGQFAYLRCSGNISSASQRLIPCGLKLRRDRELENLLLLNVGILFFFPIKIIEQ